MIRKILSIITALVLLAYLVFSAFFMTDVHGDVTECTGIDLHIQDSLHYDLIDSDMVLNLLSEHGINPVGRTMDRIDVYEMEKVLLTHPLVGKAQCYMTSGALVRINIGSKVPLVHVRNSFGQDFYVDSRGEILTDRTLAVNLPVATGYIDRSFAGSELLQVVRAIDRSDFWKAQIEQINVTRDGRFELVPRVGDHLLLIGTYENVEDKLDRLMNFYMNGLKEVGWNKYSTISVAYENQIVCKKRK